MSTGARSVRQNLFVTQPESVPGVLDSGALPKIAIDLNSDGNGYENVQRWVAEHADGINADLATVLQGDEGRVQGNFMPNYEMLEYRMNACWGLPTPTTLDDGRTKKVWKAPEMGLIDRQTFSAWYGPPGTNLSVQLLYGKIQSLTLDCVRTGEVNGRMTCHFNQAIRNQTMAGYVVVNEVLQQQTLTAASVTSAATWHGATVTPGDSTATVQAALRDIGGLWANVIVTGPGVPSASGGTVFDSGHGTFFEGNGAGTIGSSPNPALFAASGGENFSAGDYYGIIFNSAHSPASYSFTTNIGGNGDLKGFVIEGSNNTTTGRDGTWTPLATVTNNASHTPTGSLPGTSWLAIRLRATDVSNGDGASTSGLFQLTLASVASGSYVATFPTGINPALGVVTGAGWSGAISRAYVAPHDGTGPSASNAPYLQPSHAVCYKASDYTDLGTIDMGDADTPAPLDDAHRIATARAHTFSLENMVEPVYYEDRSLHPASHVDGAMNATASITLPKDEAGRCEEIYATEVGCTSQPWYFRQAYRCGDREFWIDMYVARDAQPTYPVDNNIYQRQFPLKRIFNPNGSLIFTLISPAP